MEKFLVERWMLFILRLQRFGEIPLCNGKRNRSIYIGDFCFPLCARCTAMVFSSLIVYFLTVKKIIKKNNLIVNIALVIPLVVDGVMQYGFGYESTNFRRELTGVLWGYGMGNILGTITIFPFIKKEEVKNEIDKRTI